jgi:hypothetical protein
MNSSKRRVGRPKAPHRTGPLVLQEVRSRETIEVQINSETARELAEYAAWVELSGSLTTADATFTTVDYALREVFRRDRVRQERRRKENRPREEDRPAAPATVARVGSPPSPSTLGPSPSPTPPPTLPPPSGHARTPS